MSSEMQKRFHNAYLHYLHRKGLAPQKDTGHVCNPRKCTFWTHPHAPMLYMCQNSTTIHVCGKGKCNFEYIETPEGDCVCPLTGLVLGDCSAVASFADTQRTAADFAQPREELHQVYCNKMCERAAKLIQRATGKQYTTFVQKSLQAFINLQKSKPSFINDSCAEFEMFSLALLYMCRQGVRAANIPKLDHLTDLPSPKTFASKSVRVTPFSKMTRKIIKLSQQRDLRNVFSVFTTTANT